MQLRTLTRALWTTAKIAGVLLAGAAVVFLLLTRTEHGRSLVVDRLVDRFNQNFAGSLKITNMEGTLTGGLRVLDVRLRDPGGNLVVRSRSVTFRPYWWDLLRRRVTVRSLHLEEPDLFLVRPRPGEPTTLSAALRRSTPDSLDSVRDRWEIFATDLTVNDGSIHTAAPGPPGTPPRPARFDPKNTSLDSLDLEATLEWGARSRLLDVQNASGYSPELDLPLRRLQGQLIAEPGTWTLQKILVETPGSRITFTARLDSLRSDGPPFTPDLVPEPDSSGRIHVAVAPSRISGREASLVIPGLEVRDTVRISGTADGRTDSLRVRNLTLTRGSSDVSVSGLVEGRVDSATANVQLRAAPLIDADVRALFPAAALDTLRGLRRLSGELDGELSWRILGGETGRAPSDGNGPSVHWRGSADLDADLAGGSVAGTVTAEADPSEPTQYEADLGFADLDPSVAFDRPSAAGALTGRVHLSGSGLDPGRFSGESVIHLGPSRLGTRRVDSLVLAVRRSPEQWSGRVELYQPERGGALIGTGSYRPTSSEPEYRMSLRSDRLDLAPLLSSDTLHTDLTGRLTAGGRGTTRAGYRGSAHLRLDSSSVRIPRGTLPIDPARADLVLRPPSGSDPRLEINGDLLDASISGSFTLKALTGGVRHWVRAAGRSWRTASDKYLADPPSEDSTVPAGAETGDVTASGDESSTPAGARSGSSAEPNAPPSVQRERLRAGLREAGLEDGIHGSGSVTVKRTLLLSTLTGALPRLQGPFSLSAGWYLSADTLSLDAELRGDSLTGPRLRAYGLQSEWEIRSGYGPTVTARTQITGRTLARRIDRGAQTYRDNRFEVSYADRSARVQIQSDSIGTTGALRTDLNVDLLPDRNRLTVRTLDLQLRDTHWHTPEPQTIDWYRNGWVFHDLYVRQDGNVDPELSRDSIPHVALTGTLSSGNDRSATLRTHRLRLEEFSRILALRRPWGGVLDTDVRLSRPGGMLEATGSVHVENLSFDGHPLGRLQAQSRYLPGRDRIEVDLELAHDRPLPNGIQNQLSASGVIQLPTLNTRGEYLQPGALDLSVEVAEADLFFFEDIFDSVDDVQGTTSGTGRIEGTFRRPVFQGDLQIANSTFRLPQFDLTYQVSGPVQVDRTGFHTEGARVIGPTGGEASLTGDILFNDYEFWSFDLQAQAQELQIIDVTNSRTLPWYGSIWASGTATLTGPLDGALLRAEDLTSTPSSELYIPVRGVEPETDEAFIVYVDSTGARTRRTPATRANAFVPRTAEDESVFLNNLDINLNIDAPRGSTVHLVFDPLLGDAVEAVGSGRIQLAVDNGDVTTFGTFNVTGGQYLFTASEMFSRRFQLEPGSTITWDGDPIDAQLNIQATYRTRASLAGLPGRDPSERVPMVIWLDMTGRVSSPTVDLRLAIDRDERTQVAAISSLEPILNDEERAAEYATSVLLTNSFRLTLTGDTEGLTESVDQLAFSTLSQLVANQLNRFVNHALSNVDINVGVQQGTTVQDLDVTYGVALYLLDERLVIRGQGVYETTETTTSDNLQGKITVEVRLNQSVSVEVFYRREDEILETISSTAPSYGAGVSYQTEFTSWRAFLDRRLEGWKKVWNWFTDLILPSSPPPDRAASSPADTTIVSPADSTRTDSLEAPPPPVGEATFPRETTQ